MPSPEEPSASLEKQKDVEYQHKETCDQELGCAHDLSDEYLAQALQELSPKEPKEVLAAYQMYRELMRAEPSLARGYKEALEAYWKKSNLEFYRRNLFIRPVMELGSERMLYIGPDGYYVYLGEDSSLERFREKFLINVAVQPEQFSGAVRESLIRFVIEAREKNEAQSLFPFYQRYLLEKSADSLPFEQGEEGIEAEEVLLAKAIRRMNGQALPPQAALELFENLRQVFNEPLTESLCELIAIRQGQNERLPLVHFKICDISEDTELYLSRHIWRVGRKEELAMYRRQCEDGETPSFDTRHPFSELTAKHLVDATMSIEDVQLGLKELARKLLPKSE